MVRIRLRRVGSKNQPSFRIVAAEKEAPRDGRFLEVLGHYNPRTEPSTISVDEERLFHWMKNGAQPSEAVTQALRAVGTWERWERFKGGESIEKLLEEAKKAIPEVDPRTRRDDLFGKSKKKKSKKSQEAPSEAAAEEPVVEAEEDEPAEAETPTAEMEEKVAAEAEAEPEAQVDENEPEAEPESVSEEVAKAEAETEAEAEAETETEAEAAAESEAEDTADDPEQSETEAEEEEADEA